MSEQPQSRWPPATGLSTKEIPHNHAVLTISASALITAPAPLVFDAILNVNDFPQWNTFCPKVTMVSPRADQTRLSLGTNFTFHVVMNLSKPDNLTTTDLVCCDISTPSAQSEYVARDVLEGDGSFTSDLETVYRVGWKGGEGLMSKVLKGERVHEVIVTGEGECEVRTWECQSGPAAYAVKLLYGKYLNERFGDWVRDLKGFCERKVSAGG